MSGRCFKERRHAALMGVLLQGMRRGARHGRVRVRRHDQQADTEVTCVTRCTSPFLSPYRSRPLVSLRQRVLGIWRSAPYDPNRISCGDAGKQRGARGIAASATLTLLHTGLSHRDWDCARGPGRLMFLLPHGVRRDDSRVLGDNRSAATGWCLNQGWEPVGGPQRGAGQWRVAPPGR